MLIAIICDSASLRNSVVAESIECFSKFGNFFYEIVPVTNGNFNKKLDGYDGVFLHYSLIAFPYRYQLPINAENVMKISSYRGPKIAYVQDEQRACIERFNFFQTLGISQLLSVSPDYLHETLYPSKLRDFEVTTVLTGYITDNHKSVAARVQPLNNRHTDILYRARALPEWMGKTGSLKGQIPELVTKALGRNLNNYVIDVSNLERDRLYGREWFDRLLDNRVSIATPSGSDYLDLYGMYPERWIKNFEPPPDLKPPVPAKYQVISPRYFDYLSAGNMLALTSGEYSDIPLEGEYFKLQDDCLNVEEAIEFSSHPEAQKMVNKSMHRVLGDCRYHYSTFVSTVENLFQKEGGQTHIMAHAISLNHDNTLKRTVYQQFIRSQVNKWLNPLLLKFFRHQVASIRMFYFKAQQIMRWRPFIYVIYRECEIFRVKKLKAFKSLWELVSLITFLTSYRTETSTIQNENGSLCLYFPRRNTSFLPLGKMHKVPNPNQIHIHIEDFGRTSYSTIFTNLPKVLLTYSSNLPNSLNQLIRSIRTLYQE